MVSSTFLCVSTLSWLAGIASAIGSPAVQVRGNASATAGRCSKGLPTGQTPGNVYNMTLTSSGIVRNFLLSIPSSYGAQSSVPLILSFHGGTRTSEHQLRLDQLTNPQFNTVAMVVYPQGLNNAWQNIPGRSQNAPDVQFTSDLIGYLANMYCIDSSRIWATGKSDGGGFCGTLACDPNLSKRIAAFAPVSAAFYVNSGSCDPLTAFPPCNPGRSNIPFIEFHGGKDTTIAYNGGPRRGQCLPSIPNYIQQWARRDGLGTKNQSEPFAPDSSVYRFGKGANAGLVAQYYDPVIGHDWPSTVPNSDNSQPSRHVASFNATPIILKFFQQHQLE